VGAHVRSARATGLKNCLAVAEASFEVVNVESYQCVCLDESIVNRTEAKLDCKLNKGLASVGNAYLTLYCARISFRAQCRPAAYQEERNTVTGESQLLATIGSSALLLDWQRRQQASERQKAELVVSFVCLAVLVCSKLVSVCLAGSLDRHAL
jgi:hypothetical protein